jgi:hypothetical protein
MMGRRICFDADEARRQLLKKWQNVSALELAPNNYIDVRLALTSGAKDGVIGLPTCG